jgi:hypothetical protein
MLGKMSAEMILEHEKLLFKRVLGFHSILVFNGFLPHSHELPFFELLEEILFLDVII